MKEELNAPMIEAGDAFTAELEKAAHDILNHLSDQELDRLLNDDDRTFLNQVMPSGEPLVNSCPVAFETAKVYSAGIFTLATKIHTTVSTSLGLHFVPSPDEAADRQDLALAA